MPGREDRPDEGNETAGGRPLAARLERAIDAGEWELVLRTVAEEWTSLLNEHPRVLLRALQSAPEPVLAREPRLLLAREYVQRNLSAEGHSRAYRHATRLNGPLTPVDALAALTGQIAAARANGKLRDAVRLVRRAHDLLARQPIEREASLAIALPELHHHWAMTSQMAGDFERAAEDYRESYDWAMSTGHRMMQTGSAGALAYLHALFGQTRRARRWLGRLPEREDGRWWTPVTRTAATLAEALVAADELDLPRARGALSRIHLARSPESWAEYFYVKSLVHRDDGTGVSRLAEFEEVLSSVPRGQWAGGANAEYVALTRQLLRAEVGHVHRSPQPDEIDYPSQRATLLRQLQALQSARELLLGGKKRMVRKLVSPLVKVDAARPRVAVKALLLMDGASDGGTAHLDAAVEMARWHGHLSPLLGLAGAARERAARALQAGGEAGAAAAIRGLPAPASAPRLAVLTERERLVVELALAGATTREIAERLGVSRETVKVQTRSAYRKLGFRSRQELIAHGPRLR